jgi:uncharacterized protein YdeI (YjbR/CyaY-like superfamily)
MARTAGSPILFILKVLLNEVGFNFSPSRMSEPISPRFFKGPAHFRRWLERHGAKRTELWVGYYKKGTGRASMTWPESVDEALCFGWIDGIRKAVDEFSYTIRFTPRRPTSIWSAVNIRNVQRLVTAGRMRPAGMAAFDARRENRCEIYSYEQRPRDLPESLARRMRRNTPAWQFFQAQPPGYRRQMIWWIVSARTEETQRKRLARLTEASAAQQRVR